MSEELIAGDADLYDAPLDSGFTPANIEDAEWLVANMPGSRRFHEMPTYERALICHTVARFRLRTAAALIAAGDELSRFAECNPDICFSSHGKPCTCGYDKALEEWQKVSGHE